MAKWTSDKLYMCDRCHRHVPAYYTLSHLTKGLFVQCKHCGTHARPFIDGLDLPYKPSKAYLKATDAEKSTKQQVIKATKSLLFQPDGNHCVICGTTNPTPFCFFYEDTNNSTLKPDQSKGIERLVP